MIHVKELQKRFGTARALGSVSFCAPNGSITGLLGANGAGKTTTLRIISGVLRADRGSVQIDGSDRATSDIHMRIGALLDHTGLYPRLTAQENLIYVGELHGLSRVRVNERAGELLRLLGLEEVANRRAADLSLGQRTKVALGRAMIHSPGNLLLDEPTNGLDVPSVRSLRSFLRSMRDSGVCVVFSSHVLDEVEALCDAVVILSHGEVVASGSPEAVCHHAGAASVEDAFVTVTDTRQVRHA